MADLEKKLADFSNVILNEAQAQKNALSSELEQKKNKAVSEKETELLQDAYENIQRAIGKYSKEQNERILKHEMNTKKLVIKKREKIIDDIFSEVQKRLSEFVLSSEYKDWLISAAKKTFDEIGTGSLQICERDLKYKDDLQAALPGCSVTSCGNDDIIGGFTAGCGNLSVDYTIKELLSEKRADFLKTSGLSIKA